MTTTTTTASPGTTTRRTTGNVLPSTVVGRVGPRACALEIDRGRGENYGRASESARARVYTTRNASRSGARVTRPKNEPGRARAGVVWSFWIARPRDRGSSIDLLVSAAAASHPVALVHLQTRPPLLSPKTRPPVVARPTPSLPPLNRVVHTRRNSFGRVYERGDPSRTATSSLNRSLARRLFGGVP